MTTSIFTTKEQYFSFRDAWASAVNNEKAKSHLETCDEWLSTTDTYSRNTGKHRVTGWITASHHVLFNIICNKSIDSGFTPVTNPNKLQNGMLINHGLYYGLVGLHKIQRIAKTIIEGDKVWDTFDKHFTEFLAPFNGTITVEMILALKIPKAEPLDPYYSHGKKIATKLISGEFKPKNFKELYSKLEEIERVA